MRSKGRLGEWKGHSSRQGIDHINLESYDEYLLESVKDEMVEGNLSDIYGDSDKVMTVYNKDNPLKVGDTVEIAGTEVTVTCSVNSALFSGKLLVICSQETFEIMTVCAAAAVYAPAKRIRKHGHNRDHQ